MTYNMCNMDYKYIEQLLDRYFLGETSLQEEQILKAFFAQGADDMPEELSQYAPLFHMLDEKDTLGDEFDERLIAMTEETVQVKARVVSLAERLRPLFGAAAVVAILLTLGLAINQSFRQDDTWVDAERYATIEVATGDAAVAYEQVTDSLLLEKSKSQVVNDSLQGSGIN